MLAGAEGEAEAAFTEALAQLKRFSDVEAAGRAALGAGRAAWRREALLEARTHLEKALNLLSDHESALTVEALVDLASLLVVSLGLQQEGMAHAYRAIELARRLGDERAEAVASRTLGNLLVRAMDVNGGLPLLERALELTVATDDLAEAAECCSCLSMAYMCKADLQRYFEVIRLRVEYAERCRDLYQLRHAYTWNVARFMWQGEWEAADREIERAQTVVERLESPEPRAFLLYFRGVME